MAGVPFKPPAIDWKDEDPTSRGTLFPIEWNQRTGGARAAAPQALLDLLEAIMLPGRALSGEFNQVEISPDGSVSPMDPRLIDAAAEAALAIGTPSASVASTMQPDPNLLNIFAGARSRTANLEARDEAHNLAQGQIAYNSEKLGKKTGLTDQDVNEIFEATGWFPGADNQWRYEIPDVVRPRAGLPNPDEAFMKYAEDQKRLWGPRATSQGLWKNASVEVPPVTRQGTLEQFIDHPDLFKAYPEIANLKTRTTGAPGTPQNGVNNMNGTIEASAGTQQDLISVLLHEVQHQVQLEEGFANGGNPDWMGQYLAELVPSAKEQLDYPKPYEMYRALMGEVEARTVQERFEIGPSSSASPAIWTPGEQGFADTPRKHQFDPMWFANAENLPEVKKMSNEDWAKMATGKGVNPEDLLKKRLKDYAKFLREQEAENSIMKAASK